MKIYVVEVILKHDKQTFAPDEIAHFEVEARNLIEAWTKALSQAVKMRDYATISVREKGAAE